jgi:hypothetical protein
LKRVQSTLEIAMRPKVKVVIRMKRPVSK